MGDQKVKRNEDKSRGVSPAREMPPPDDESTVSLLRELVGPPCGKTERSSVRSGRGASRRPSYSGR